MDATHIGVDLFSQSDQNAVGLYDESNNIIYGVIRAGRTEVLDLVRPAFHDFDAYASEFSSVHEQLKREQSGKSRFSLGPTDNQDRALTEE